MAAWKDYTTEKTIIVTEKSCESHQAQNNKFLPEKTVSICYACMTEPIKEIMKEIVDMGEKRKGGGEGSQDMDLGEIQELIDTTPEEVTEDRLREISDGLVFRPQYFLCYDLDFILVQGTKILQTAWRG